MRSSVRVHLIAGGLLDLRGDVRADDLELFGGEATVRGSARLSARG